MLCMPGHVWPDFAAPAPSPSPPHLLTHSCLQFVRVSLSMLQLITPHPACHCVPLALLNCARWALASSARLPLLAGAFNANYFLWHINCYMATIVPRPRTARTPTLTHAVATCLNTPQSFRCAMFAQRFGEGKKFKCKTKIKYKCQVLMEAPPPPLPTSPTAPFLHKHVCVCVCRQHLTLAKQSVQLQQTLVLL